MTDVDLDMILGLISDQAPAFIVSPDGIIYEGHLQALLRGELVVVGAPYGSGLSRAEYRWPVTDVEVAPNSVETFEELEDDALQEYARGIVEKAEEVGKMTLAERIIRERGL